MSTNIESIRDILIRDLNALGKEVSDYTKSDDMWLLKGSIKNSAGNLVLRICGNIQHFVGEMIGQSEYQRERELEFSSTGLSKEELLIEINNTKASVEKALDSINDELLESIYPIEVFGKPITYSCFLIHLTGHLMYHLGQVNYHRHLLMP